MSKINLCLKYEIEPEAVDAIIKKLLGQVPSDALEPFEIDVIFDLLRNGDIPAVDDKKQLDAISFRLQNILMGLIPCDNCPMKAFCKNKDNPDAKIVDCATALMFIAQAYSLSDLNELATTKIDIQRYVDKKYKDKEFLELCETVVKDANV